MVVAFAIATVLVVFLVMLGGFSETPYMEGTLTSSANATLWNSATTFFGGYAMGDVVIPVVVTAVVLIVGLFFVYRFAGRAARL